MRPFILKLFVFWFFLIWNAEWSSWFVDGTELQVLVFWLSIGMSLVRTQVSHSPVMTEKMVLASHTLIASHCLMEMGFNLYYPHVEWMGAVPSFFRYNCLD